MLSEWYQNPWFQTHGSCLKILSYRWYCLKSCLNLSLYAVCAHVYVSGCTFSTGRKSHHRSRILSCLCQPTRCLSMLVLHLPPFVFAAPAEEVVGLYGGSVTLDCDLRKADPPVVAWADLVWNTETTPVMIFNRSHLRFVYNAVSFKDILVQCTYFWDICYM